MLQNLTKKKLILASKSPRRQDLLGGLDIDFEIRTKEIEENYPAHLEIDKVPEFLAKLKASAFEGELADDEILITSDTVVILGDKILEKPQTRKEAIEMIQQLQNNTHTVVTAVCISSTSKMAFFDNHTKVTFCPLSTEEIEYYIDTYEPFDKAGSYGCQEWIGYIAIEKIEGSFYSVMGLPSQQLYQHLKKF
jgi:nucleoside triphosphate pyrophosphatase